MEKVKGNAAMIADKIAHVMHLYPYVIGTRPPRIFDIDEAFSRYRYMINFHVPAAHPDPEHP